MQRRSDAGRPFPCPCCGSPTIDDPGHFEVCPVCAWEDDPIQSHDPGYAGGANVESLNEARTRWQARTRGRPDRGPAPP